MYGASFLARGFFPFDFAFPLSTRDDSVCEACDSECGGECGGECGEKPFDYIGLGSFVVRKRVAENMASGFGNMMASSLHIVRMMASGFAGVEKNGRMMV
ncbi:hypothetical protein Tco_0387285 [Tanacetum coccineum]